MKPFCLVIDDSPLYCEAMCQLMQICFPHLSLRTAADGSTGLAFARQPGCMLILLDYQLPGLNGSDVVRHLRKYTERMETAMPPIVMMSTQPDVAIFTRSLGVTAFLPKPVLEDDLIRVISPLLTRVDTTPTTQPRRLWRIQPIA